MSDRVVIVAGMTDTWLAVSKLLNGVLTSTHWGGFVVVEFDPDGLGDAAPFVQAAPGPAGWYVEVQSADYRPAGTLLPDEEWLVQHGWQAPDATPGNWWQQGVDALAVAEVLLDALRHAYWAGDPGQVQMWTGVFPSGPRGGKPVERHLIAA
jgi:hypothetical protein